MSLLLYSYPELLNGYKSLLSETSPQVLPYGHASHIAMNKPYL